MTRVIVVSEHALSVRGMMSGAVIPSAPSHKYHVCVNQAASQKRSNLRASWSAAQSPRLCSRAVGSDADHRFVESASDSLIVCKRRPEAQGGRPRPGAIRQPSSRAPRSLQRKLTGPRHKFRLNRERARVQPETVLLGTSASCTVS